MALKFGKRDDKGAFDEESRRRSLSFLEDRREKIVNKISRAMDIPEDEFIPGNDTAFFHFLSSALALADWTYDACMAVHEESDYGGSPLRRAALEKITAAGLIRLALLPSVHGFDEGDDDAKQRGQIAGAFIKASKVNSVMASFVLMSWSTIRAFVTEIAASYEDGVVNGPSMEFFDGLKNGIDKIDKDGFIVPREAALDACSQIFREFRLVAEIRPFPGLPEDCSMAKAFAVGRDYLLPAAYLRYPVVFDGEKFSQKGIVLDEVVEFFDRGDKHPKALIESVYLVDGAPELMLFFSHDSRRREWTLEAFRAAQETGMKQKATNFALI